MPINLTKLLETENTNTGTGTGTTWMKIQRPAGEFHDYELRILPPLGNNEIPWHHERLHYFQTPSGLKVGAVKGKDPANDLYWKLRDNPTVKDDPAMSAALRRLKAADKYYYNVVDRSDNTVKVLSIPYSAHDLIKKELITYLTDDMDITDPEEGFDIVLTVKPATVFGKPSHEYSSVSVRPKPKPIEVENWEDRTITLEDEAVTNFFTTEEVEEMLPEILGEFYDTVMGLTNG